MPAASASSCSAASGCQRSWTAPMRSGAREGSSTRANDGGTSPTELISRGSLTGSACRNLLGDAVGPAAAVGEHGTGHAYRLAPGIGVLDRRERVLVGL